MAGFSLTSILNSKTLSQATDSHKVKYIDRTKIFPNPYNPKVYNTDNIEFLSYGIEEDGLLEPLIVVSYEKFDNPEENTYLIASGHRRMLAINMIIERGSPKAKDFDRIPCIERESNGNDEELLLNGNIYNRNKTDAERAMELAEKKRKMLERKAKGEKISGRLLDLIAKEMEISLHQAKKFNAINNNATDAVKEAFNSGDISTEAAYELSKAEPEKQNEIISNADEPITAKKIKVELNKDHERPAPAENESILDTQNDSSYGDDLPYGKALTDNESDQTDKMNFENTTEEKEDSAPPATSVNKRLEALSEVSKLLKIFSRSDYSIELGEDEISSIKDSLNLIYQYISKKR